MIELQVASLLPFSCGDWNWQALPLPAFNDGYGKPVRQNYPLWPLAKKRTYGIMMSMVHYSSRHCKKNSEKAAIAIDEFTLMP